MLFIVLVVSLVTITLRLTPVFLFGRGGKPLPPLVQYLSRVMPSAIISLLVVYSFKAIRFAPPTFAIPEMAGAIIAAGLQWKTKNTLLSIFAATACYMLLIRLF